MHNNYDIYLITSHLNEKISGKKFLHNIVVMTTFLHEYIKTE